MAMNDEVLGKRRDNPWRFVGWGIAATLLLLPLALFHRAAMSRA